VGATEVIEQERDFRSGSMVLKTSVFVVALDPSQSSFPERATIAPGNNREGAPHVECSHAGPRAGFLFGGGGLCARLRTPLRRTKMIFDYSLAAVVAAGLLCYLIYALLRPERF
jgi:K+-transporting ATPase KdpF subunit